MLIEKAIQRFNERGHRILFFFDEDGEYLEEINEYTGEEFLLIKPEGRYFHTKYLVEIAHPEENKLLYFEGKRPETEEEYRKFPLTDLLIANGELLVDEVSDLIDKYSLSHRHAPLILKFKKWLKSKKNLAAILPFLTEKPFREDRFRAAVLSLVLKERKTGNNVFNLITVFEVLNKGENKWEKLKTLIEKNKLDDTLREAVRKETGMEIESLSYEDMKALFLKMKYNVLTGNRVTPLEEDPYRKLKVTDAAVIRKTDSFFRAWEDDRKRSASLKKVLSGLGADVDEERLLKAYGIDTEFGLKSEKQTAYILRHARDIIYDNPNWVITRFGSWKNNAEDYEGYEKQLEFLLNTAHYLILRKSFKNFDFDSIPEYFKNYKDRICHLDLFYRHAFTRYQELKRNDETKELDELFDRITKDYENYLIELNRSWIRLLDEKGFKLTEAGVPMQFDFYKDRIADNDSKRAVIISDAFRYELALDLMKELADPGNKMELDAMMAPIPSYTALGMSNLLPNKNVEATAGDSEITYSIEGISTAGSVNRKKILQAFEPDSDLISYESFIKWGIGKQREFLKEKRVVYIYHDWMDTVGDDRASEYYSFESVEQCIAQLCTLINRLFRSLNTYNIVVTADHGFLFNYTEIKESSRQDYPKLKNSLKDHTRFCITTDKEEYSNTLKFNLADTTNIKTDLKVVLPKNINRFRRSGSGIQFVHGGASLQETLVPVLEFYRERRSAAEDVRFSRLDKTGSMSTPLGKFEIVQDDRVDEDHKPVSIVLGLYDISNNLISNEVELELDSAEKLATQRKFEIRLELTAEGTVAKMAYLRAYNKEDVERLNPVSINDMIKINLLTERDDF